MVDESVLRLNPQKLLDITAARRLLSAYFDEKFYKVQCKGPMPHDLFTHFYKDGWKEGLCPNHMFDVSWYLEQYPIVKTVGVNPLLEYVLVGEKQDRNPSRLFDTEWYRTNYKLGVDVSPLAHYLQNRCGPYSPVPEFDAAYYLGAYKDVAEINIDPFYHYMNWGYKEARKPRADFETERYVRRFMGGDETVNPILHFRSHRSDPAFILEYNSEERNSFGDVRKNTTRDPLFEEIYDNIDIIPRAKILTFYLPQFHSIPENDEWWGAGFTEWTNIARGQPRFEGHYQPRIPRDLGFYNLSDVNVMRKQARMARASGIFGFVFYYYNFSGKRLLERPIEQFIANHDVDIPFCLMWANENWTRRWDGADQEILIAQGQDHETESFCSDIARHLLDRRYIRLGGRPLIMIYRAGVINNVDQQILRWRSSFKYHHNEDPIFVMAQCFDDVDPRLSGFDGAVEFPPHKLVNSAKNIANELNIYDNSFGARVYAYEDLIDISLNEPRSKFPLIKTALTSWDNDARRQGKGMVIHSSTPEAYERWLAGLIDDAERNRFFGEAIVCINAWNEWCEGAYLEPDVHFGAAYLNATARAVGGLNRPFGKMLLVGHDAFPAGAQQLLLKIGLHLKRAFGFQIEVILLSGGALEAEYEAIGQVFRPASKEQLADFVSSKKRSGFCSAIVNTCAAGSVVPLLKQEAVQVTFLVHEMPIMLKDKCLMGSAQVGLLTADISVFPTNTVKRAVLAALSVPDGHRFVARPQGLYRNRPANIRVAQEIRFRLGLKSTSVLVIGAGYADLRKGFDLFVATWKLSRTKNTDVHFCWLGNVEPQIAEWFQPDILAAEKTGTFHMLGFCEDPENYYAAADVFLLPSREDPFPSVALEALNAGLPIIAFEGTGGIPELISEANLGIIVNSGDFSALASAIDKAVALRRDQAFLERAEYTMRTRFSFDEYVKWLWSVTATDTPTLSIAVITYNHAPYLAERFQSVSHQDMPASEIIVVDDASTDASIEAITSIAEQYDRYISVIVNETRCGSPYLQWKRAAEATTGEFIWLAEGDDAANRAFAYRLLRVMKADDNMVMCFCDSRSVDQSNNTVFENYKEYYSTVESGALSQDEVFDGRDFIKRFLLVKNLILNVSAVLWRRDALLRSLKNCEENLRSVTITGDWLVYIQCLSTELSRIGYVADTLNSHRRHVTSLTGGLSMEAHLGEITAMHTYIGRRFAVSDGVKTAQYAYQKELRSRIETG